MSPHTARNIIFSMVEFLLLATGTAALLAIALS